MKEELRKKDIIDLIAEDTRLTKKEVTDMFNSFHMIIENSVKEKRPVSIRGLFSIKYRETGDFVKKNPRTGEDINVKSYTKSIIKLAERYRKPVKMD